MNVDYPEGGLVSLRWLFSWDIISSFLAKFFVIVKLSLPPLSLYIITDIIVGFDNDKDPTYNLRISIGSYVIRYEEQQLIDAK